MNVPALLVKMGETVWMQPTALFAIANQGLLVHYVR